jgi:hypothetical protein
MISYPDFQAKAGPIKRLKTAIRARLRFLVFFVISVFLVFGPIANMYDRDDLSSVLLLYLVPSALVSMFMAAFLLGYTENHSWIAMKAGFWLALLILIFSWVLVFIIPIVSNANELSVSFGSGIVKVNPSIGGLPFAISLAVLGAFFSSWEGYMTIVVFLILGIVASRCGIALKQHFYRKKKEELETLAKLR